MSDRPLNPFNAPEPESLNLVRNDLARVLCQVTFPEMEEMADLSVVGAFQHAVRSAYPVLVPEQMNAINVTPQGAQMTATPIWRFHDPEQVWRASLTAGAMTLETRTYVSRQDFLRRLSAVLDSLCQHVKPKQVSRIGVRYVNHVRLASPADAASVFQPGVIGEAVLAAASAPGSKHALTEMAGELHEGGMTTARWAILPPGGTHDASVMPPMPSVTCMLDVDSFSDWSAAPKSFDAAAILAEAGRLAGRSNAFFRWAVSDAYLKQLTVHEYGQPGVWKVAAKLH